jgi:hypothetical protein
MKVATGYHPATQVDDDLGRLVEYRDALVRRTPREWALRVNELPRMTRNALGVIEFLGWSPGHIAWQREATTDLARAKHMASLKVIEALEGQYRS